MTQRAMEWDVAPEGDPPADPELLWPAVLPVPKVQPTRHVGVVKAYSPPKIYGLVEDAGNGCDAIFCIDDVDPLDRARIGSGQTVTFEAITGADGLTAKQIRIDATTLPPPPDASLIVKGWR